MNGGLWSVYTICAAVCGAGLLLTLWGEFHVKPPAVASGKLIAATAYCAAALSLGAAYSRYGRLLLAAMLFCWLGDLLLVSRKSRRLFVGGLAAFLVGHLFYFNAFWVRGIEAGAVLAGLVLMGVFSWTVINWLKPHLDQGMKVPVYLYVTAISAMMVAAIGTFSSVPGLALLAGAALFIVSDLAVARNRFVSAGFINRAWGLPVYFTAQFLLAASILN